MTLLAICLFVVGYLAATVVMAGLILPLLDESADSREEPFVMGFFGLLWPLILVGLVGATPVWVIGKAAGWLHEASR